ncbi:hypothetical protein TRFO_32597 [Tritrichomonas foetus]|uniref:Uncharacterized protein n=1 Tax=Tritrichomonas foetus TaxID=1144522 RepID=A0A1J4JNI2_9EUKA|nr:hypothetical protein TRFO_32597 [Tritrichomonas foetus]|eukprot:OHT00681.1 hypothetical protein TRFO_32597 [Tritrichomonas foetus]
MKKLILISVGYGKFYLQMKNPRDELKSLIYEDKDQKRKKFSGETVGEMEVIMMKRCPEYFIKLHKDFEKKALLFEILELQIHNKKNKIVYKSPGESKKGNKTASGYSGYQIPWYNSEIFALRYSHIKNDTMPVFTKPDKFKDILIDFFSQNSQFLYYFWNVTFPNVLGSFLSLEYCSTAKNFLLTFSNNFDFVFPGYISFLRHNFYFQNQFLRSFYMQICSESVDPLTALSEAFIFATTKLNIHQFQILVELGEHKERYKDIFVELFYNQLELWQYSSLLSPGDFLRQNRLNTCERVEELLKDHDISKSDPKFVGNTNLEDFMINIFDNIQEDLITNDIKLSEVIYTYQDVYIITYLDVILLTKLMIKPENECARLKKYLEAPLDTNYFFDEALRFTFIENGLPNADKVPVGKFKPEGDIQHILAWENTKRSFILNGIDYYGVLIDKNHNFDSQLIDCARKNEIKLIYRSEEIKKEMVKRMPQYGKIRLHLDAQDDLLQMVSALLVDVFAKIIIHKSTGKTYKEFYSSNILFILKKKISLEMENKNKTSYQEALNKSIHEFKFPESSFVDDDNRTYDIYQAYITIRTTSFNRLCPTSRSTQNTSQSTVTNKETELINTALTFCDIVSRGITYIYFRDNTKNLIDDLVYRKTPFFECSESFINEHLSDYLPSGAFSYIFSFISQLENNKENPKKGDPKQKSFYLTFEAVPVINKMLESMIDRPDQVPNNRHLFHEQCFDFALPDRSEPFPLTQSNLVRVRAEQIFWYSFIQAGIENPHECLETLCQELALADYYITKHFKSHSIHLSRLQKEFDILNEYINFKGEKKPSETDLTDET